MSLRRSRRCVRAQQTQNGAATRRHWSLSIRSRLQSQCLANIPAGGSPWVFALKPQ
jgi:hypothetical protein